MWRELRQNLCLFSGENNPTLELFCCKNQSLVVEAGQALTRFSILRKSREEMVHFFLSQAGELNVHSNFSQQKHFGDSTLQHTIFILELDVRTPLCGGDNFSFLGQKKNKTEIGM